MAGNTKSQSVRTRYHKVVDETLKSIVLDVTLPGTGERATIRVPKKLCRNWTKETVDIYSGYYANGVTRVNVLRKATAAEFDAAGDNSDVIRMPLCQHGDIKHRAIDEAMTTYTCYERLGVRN